MRTEDLVSQSERSSTVQAGNIWVPDLDKIKHYRIYVAIASQSRIRRQPAQLSMPLVHVLAM